MKLSNIIKEGIVYPTTNFKYLIILGIIFVLQTQLGRLNTYTPNQIAIIIGIILSVILFILLEGYKVDIIGHGIKRDNEFVLPHKGNFISGIKSIIVEIVYYLIPLIIVIIAGYFTGFIGSAIKLYTALQTAGLSSGTASITITYGELQAFYNSMTITLIIGVIFFIIFSLFAYIALGRLAETNSVIQALKINDIITKAKKIGWFKILIYIIAMLILITFILGFTILLQFIPYIGAIIAALIIYPYIYLLLYYSMGLLYR